MVSDLPNNHPHGLSELELYVNYSGDSSGRKGIALDHDIMPAIVAALNCDNASKEAAEAVKRRKDAADKWAEDFFAARSGGVTGTQRKALAVITGTAGIRDYLAEFDPMALKQAQEALNGKSYIDYLTS